MHKYVKYALAVSACMVLTGCPKVTAVTGTVGLQSTGSIQTGRLQVGDSLSAGAFYVVDDGASITVQYDNGKSCTFTRDFVPGTDGSVCEKKDRDDKKQDKDDQQQDQQQDQQSGRGQQQPDASNPNSGIGAPAVNPTPVPDYSGINAPAGTGSSIADYSGIGGPQVIATAVPTYTRFMQVLGNPILTNTLAVIGAVSVAKEIHDQTNGNGGDEPISK